MGMVAKQVGHKWFTVVQNISYSLLFVQEKECAGDMDRKEELNQNMSFEHKNCFLKHKKVNTLIFFWQFNVDFQIVNNCNPLDLIQNLWNIFFDGLNKNENNGL